MFLMNERSFKLFIATFTRISVYRRSMRFPARMSTDRMINRSAGIVNNLEHITIQFCDRDVPRCEATSFGLTLEESFSLGHASFHATRSINVEVPEMSLHENRSPGTIVYLIVIFFVRSESHVKISRDTSTSWDRKDVRSFREVEAKSRLFNCRKLME